MRCPPPWRLAAAASGEDPAAAAHGEQCPRCAGLLAEQRGVIELARRWSPPPLLASARAQLSAEVMARDVVVRAPSRRARWITSGVAGLAAAASIVLVLARQVEVEHPDLQVTIARPLPVPNAPKTPPVVEPAAPRPEPEDVPLRDGTLALDTAGRGPVRVMKNGMPVAVARGRVELSSRGGLIVAVRVFAGSVEINDRTKSFVVAAGDVWVRPQPAQPKQPPSAPPEPATSLALFRTGWEALHAGHDADALAAFDRAADPVIREDALFWAAVAAERTGDRDGAARRLRLFLHQFPESPRADDARTRLAELVD